MRSSIFFPASDFLPELSVLVSPRDSMSGVSRISALTFCFSDESMEKALLSDTLDVASTAVLFFGALNLVLNFHAGTVTGFTIPYLSVTYIGGIAAVCYVRKRYPAHEAHRLISILWSFAWSLGMGYWWWLVHAGAMSRVGADEGHRAASACALWVSVSIVQHVVHIDAAQRAVVLVMAMTIVISSPFWRTELLASLLLGEASGCALDHMLRASFRAKQVRLEQLRREKERVEFDLAISESRFRRHSLGSRQGRVGLSRENSRGSSRGSSDGGSSCDTNSELATFNSAARNDASRRARSKSPAPRSPAPRSRRGNGISHVIDEGSHEGSLEGSNHGSNSPDAEGWNPAHSRILSSSCERALWRTLEESSLLPTQR